MNVGLEIKEPRKFIQDDNSTILQVIKEPELNDSTSIGTNSALRDCFQKISNIRKDITILTNQIKKIEKNLTIVELEKKLNKYYEQIGCRKRNS